MAKTYADIEKQIKELQAKAEALRKDEVATVIARIKEAILKYELTASDLGLGVRAPLKTKVVAPPPAKRPAAKAKRGTGKVAVKFRDKNGNTWTGRGNQPVWLREAIRGGAKIESFRI
ncbi:MAG: H-NS histone family protein [Burkholderiales bacterium]|nr:H-NS histone family protein [Burkholderiales bacterium]